MADFGCGFNAGLARETRHLVTSSVIVDVALDEELLESSEFDAYVGILPNVLERVPPHSLDLVVMNSVLEHLDFPVETLEIIRRILKPGGMLFINVPSWFGKIFLEFTSFRLNLSPAEEMEDHRRYYDKRELWLELRRSGFLPSKMKIRRHKLGMNVFAIATVEKS
jgi:SAM-dependent methyltransferase